jgi:hypothetical protein
MADAKIGYAISGRSVANYKEKGHAIPANVVIKPCASCKQEVTLGPAGVAALAEHTGAYVLCTPCAMVAVAARKGRMTQFVDLPGAVEHYNRSADARRTREMFNEFLKNPK